MPISSAYMLRILDHANRAAARSAELAPPAPHPERLRGLTFTPGARAIDLVTGQEVEIVQGHETPTVVSAPRPQLDGNVHGETAER